MIIIAQLVRLPRPSGSEGACYLARCRWHGRQIQAVAQSGAAHELCRELVKAGCPDIPVDFRDDENRTVLWVRSVHQSAGMLGTAA
jgi:hypothetical protein